MPPPSKNAPPSKDEIDDIAALALGLIKISRPIIGEWFRGNPDISRKADASPVTIADRAVERALRAEISQYFPEHGIIGEEEGVSAPTHAPNHAPDRDFVWVLDPIDGTRAFSTGNPMFGTLIGVLYRSKPVVGVIDIPTQDQTWLGVEGRRTELNGRVARVSGQEDMSRARLSTTSGHALNEDTPRFEKLSHEVLVTGYGGDCANYGHLASGWTDIVAESHLKAHDIMAIVPIIEGAGGMISQWDGRPITLEGYDGTALASASPKLHDEASRLLMI